MARLGQTWERIPMRTMASARRRLLEGELRARDSVVAMIPFEGDLTGGI